MYYRHGYDKLCCILESTANGHLTGLVLHAFIMLACQPLAFCCHGNRVNNRPKIYINMRMKYVSGAYMNRKSVLLHARGVSIIEVRICQKHYGLVFYT